MTTYTSRRGKGLASGGAIARAMSQIAMMEIFPSPGRNVAPAQGLEVAFTRAFVELGLPREGGMTRELGERRLEGQSLYRHISRSAAVTVIR